MQIAQMHDLFYCLFLYVWYYQFNFIVNISFFFYLGNFFFHSWILLIVLLSEFAAGICRNSQIV